MQTKYKFIVYALSMEENGSETFYIGKGSNYRLGSHMPQARAGHLCPKCTMLRHILKEDLRCWATVLLQTNDEDYALWFEMKTITAFPYGSLCNLIGGCHPIKATFRNMDGYRMGEIFEYDREGTAKRRYSRLGADQMECEEQLLEYYDELVLGIYLNRVPANLNDFYNGLSVKWRITPRRTPRLL